MPKSGNFEQKAVTLENQNRSQKAVTFSLNHVTILFIILPKITDSLVEANI